MTVRILLVGGLLDTPERQGVYATVEACRQEGRRLTEKTPGVAVTEKTDGHPWWTCVRKEVQQPER
jgi:hypothetical protein